MLHHRTNDPAERAESIADKAAEKVYREAYDYIASCKTWIKVYNEALREFCFQEDALFNT